MPVIKNIPFAIYLHYTAMVVSTIIHGFFCRLICVNMEITITDYNTLVLKTFCGVLTGSITQFMHDNRRVDKIIGVSSLPYRGSLKKLMPFKTCPLAIGFTGSYYNRFLNDC